MNNKSFVVIGANYGDEGKGLITDYLTRKHKSQYVVRFNGGAQAGHTVVDPSGTNHIFSHIGSGTLAGAQTYLTDDFIVNLYMLVKEKKELCSKNIYPKVFCDPLARVTLTYDVALNHLAEFLRKESKHGSCGLGINETVTRDSNGFRLQIKDLLEDVDVLEKKIRDIHTQWIPYRLAELLTPFDADEDLSMFHLQTSNILLKDNFRNHAEYLKKAVKTIFIEDTLNITSSSLPLIMEGAQGLALDEFMGEYPHVTRSKTGLPNAVKFCIDHEIDNIQPVYVTRAYLTRHGAGPLFREGEAYSDNKIVCRTNVYNEFQGDMRYAPLDLSHMMNSIVMDIDRVSSNSVLPPKIAVTCLDQASEFYIIDVEGKKRILDSYDVPAFIEKDTGISVDYISFGPTWTNVFEKKDKIFQKKIDKLTI